MTIVNTENITQVVISGQQGPAGAQGPLGEDGKTAYQVAVDNGFVGTESQWLTSLEADASQLLVDHIAVNNPHSITASTVGAYTASQVDTLLLDKASTGHDHVGVYEPADATILKDADVGVSVAAAGHDHIGVYEPANANIQTHVGDITTNPHGVTKTMVGLGSVENYAPADMPVSTATASAIDAVADTSLKVLDVYDDFVAVGLSTPVPVASLTGILSVGVAYVQGVRTERTSTDSYDYPVSSDTYVDINDAGTIARNAVANGAAEPTLGAGYFRLERVVTNATEITSVVRYAKSKPLTINIFESFSKFPPVGSSEVLYLASDSGVSFTWSGTAYAAKNPGLIIDANNNVVGLWGYNNKPIPLAMLYAFPDTPQVYCSPIAGEPDLVNNYSLSSSVQHIGVGFLLPKAGILTEIGFITQGNAGTGATVQVRWSLCEIVGDPASGTGIKTGQCFATGLTEVADNFNGAVALTSAQSLAVPAQFMVFFKTAATLKVQLMNSAGPVPGVVGFVSGSILTSAATYSAFMNFNNPPSAMPADEFINVINLKGIAAYIKWKGQ